MNDPELQEFVNLQRSAEDEDFTETRSMRRARTVFDFVEIATFTVLIILLLSCFFLRHAVVEGASMDQTLADGQHLIISDFLYSPKNGDIIVFQPLNAESTAPLIKRVIATEGQTVQMQDGVVFVNGVAISEPYVYLDGEISPDHANYPETLIPEGFVFVLGDHRNNSKDSRYEEIGLVDVRSILGRVILRVTPFSKFGAVN